MLKIQDKKTNSLESVKQLYDSGNYFEEAYNWYCVRFLSPLSERIFFGFLFIISLVIVAILAYIIYGILPLSESFPVLIHQEDAAVYQAKINKLRPANLNYTANQSVARYISIFYITKLLDNSYTAGNLATLNQNLNRKLDILKKYSTDVAYLKVSNFLNKVNQDLFNQNIQQYLTIQRFKFLQRHSMFDTSNLYKVEFDYKLTTVGANNEQISDDDYKIDLTFRFDGIKYDNKTKSFSPIVYLVNDFDIKKVN